ncbi:MAG: hypothetical protein KJ941_05775 [Bacteroidetes bacterium]|nr:hypothetical protein [Bacteroidota bacterium]
MKKLAFKEITIKISEEDEPLCLELFNRLGFSIVNQNESTHGKDWHAEIIMERLKNKKKDKKKKSKKEFYTLLDELRKSNGI